MDEALKDILWEKAGSIMSSPLLTPFELTKSTTTVVSSSKNIAPEASSNGSEMDRCAVCCEPTDLSSQQVKILSCSHRYHLSCLDEQDTKFARCVLCRKLWEDNSNLLDSAAVHLPFDSFLLQDSMLCSDAATTTEASKTLPTSAFLRIGKALMDQDQNASHAQLEPTSSEAQAKGLALLFMLAQATDEDIDESSSDG